MATNQIKVNLQFGADTSRAKASLQELSQAMNNILNSTSKMSFGSGLSKDLIQAKDEAIKLQAILNQSVNFNTGKFDLKKFSQSLKESGTNLKQLRDNLVKLGPEGEQAFLGLTKSIMTAEAPAKKVNAQIQKMADSLKSTARWKISSTIINQFSGALQTAYHYAQDLNKSLNDIRIVTGYSEEKMASFAKTANKAAGQLRTTTNEYTKASLIYFQQGLSDSEVKARTDTTIKLANVTGRSAEEISSYMTAVWNNFDDGSEKLEYYADAIAALGAATASSSEEIATGLQKFAAVANTVGLSYEYATAALATVTSQTRESAETVGTAFKTIFARLESLSLGETLEDDTSMTKYSEALAQIGVNIKTSNGELKNMDTILDEVGNRWGMINKDQQVALAQTVAGMRQYNNFIALMDNYQTFSGNVELAKDSEGALQAQADTYAEGWEAARDNVTAAAEEIWDKLINDDFFIDLLETIEKMIKGFSTFIDSIGGLPGLLTTISTILTKIFQKQIAGFLNTSGERIKSGISNLKNIPKYITNQKVETKESALQKEANSLLENYSPISGEYPESLKQSQQGLSLLMKLQEEINAKEEHLTATQKEQLQLKMKSLEIAHQQIVAKTKEAEQANAELQRAKERLRLNQVERAEAAAAALDKGRQKQESITGELVSYQNFVGKHTAVNTPLDAGAVYSDVMDQIAYLEETYDTASEKWAKTMTDNLKEVAKQIEEIMKNANKEGVDVAKEIREVLSSSDEGMAQAMEADRARQFAQDTGMEYKEGVSVVRAMDEAAQVRAVEWRGSEEEQVAKRQTLAIEEEARTQAVEIAKSGDTMQNQAVNEYQKALNVESSAGVEADAILSGLAEDLDKKHVTLKESLERFAEKVEKFSETYGESEPEMAAALEKAKASLEAQAADESNKDSKGRTKKGTKSKLKASAEESSEEIKEARQKSRAKKRKKAEVKTGKDQDAQKALDAVEVKVDGLEEAKEGFEELQTQAKDTQEKLEKPIKPTIGDAIAAAANSMMSLMSIAQTLSGTIQTVMNPDATGWEKVNAVMSGFATIAMSTISLLNTLTAVEWKGVWAKIASADATMGDTLAKSKNIIVSKLFETAKKSETGAVVANAAAWYAHPIMWIVAILAAAVIGIVAVTAALNAQSKAQAEARQAQIDLAKENLELIDSNQELSDSISDLTDDYKELQASGEDTYEMYKKLEDQIPSLIDSYKELSGAMLLDPAILSELEQAYELFKQTGDVSAFEKAQKKADLAVAKAKKEQAQLGMNAALAQVEVDAREGKGMRVGGDGYNYSRTFGGIEGGGAARDETEAQKILKEQLGDMYEGTSRTKGKSKVDFNDSKQVLKYYNALQKAKQEMQSTMNAKQLAESGTYENLEAELENLQETIGSLQEFQGTFYEIAQEAFAAGEGQDYLKQVFGGQIESLEEYENKQEELFAAIRKEYGELTDEQIRALLASSEEFKSMEVGRSWFSDDGPIAEQVKLNGTIALDDVKAWWNDLSAEDKTLAFSIDFSNTNSIDEANIKLAELQEEGANLAIKAEAEALKIDSDVLEIYSNLLADTNDQLERGASLTNRVALNYLKMADALDAINDVFDKHIDVLKEGNTLSPVYAKALAEVQNAIEGAFKINFSDNSTFIKDNLDLLEQFTKFNFSNWDEFQKGIALERVAAMSADDLKAKEDYTGIVYTEQQAKERLNWSLNSLNTEDAVAGDYININDQALGYFNNMLEAGQLTADELTQIFTDMGLQAEFENGKLKNSVQKVSDETTAKKAFGLQGDTIKARRKEIDLLHEEKKALDALNRTGTKLSIIKDNAYGKERLEYMAAENELLEDQLEATIELRNSAQAQADDTKEDLVSMFQQLETEYGDLGIDLKFNENGSLANYEEVLYAISSRVNDTDLSNFTSALDLWESQAEAVENYDADILQLHNDLDNMFADYLNETLELQIEINDKALEHLQRQLEKLEDQSFSSAKAISSLTEQANIKLIEYNQHEQAILALAKESGVETDNKSTSQIYQELLESNKLSASQTENLYKWYDGMVGASESLLDINEQLHEQVIKHFEDMVEQYGKFAAKGEEINKMISDYQNIADILGGGLLNINIKEFTRDMQKASGVIATEQLKMSKITLERLEHDRQAIKEKYEEALKDNPEEAKRLKKDLEDVDTMITETGENIRQNWVDALQAAVDSLSTQMEIIAEEFETTIAGSFGSLEEMSKKFEQESEKNERYLSDYKKIYELSKLDRQLDAKVNDASSVRSKQKLLEIEREIKEFEAQGKKMSEYDLKYLQQKYNLKLAEIALEESQNQKSQVQLTQMANGAWGYVYTANAEEADKAMQAYEDALYSAQTTSDEYLQTLSSNILQLNQNVSQALMDIWNNTDLTLEQKRAKSDELSQYYKEQFQYYTEEYEKATDNNYTLYFSDWVNFSSMTNKKIGDASEFSTTFKDTVLGSMKEGVNTADDLYTEFATAIGSTTEPESFIGKLNDAATTATVNLNKIMETAGSSLGTYGDQVADELFGQNGTTDNPTNTSIIGGFKELQKVFEGELTKWNTENKQYQTLNDLLKVLDDWWTDEQNGMSKKISDVQTGITDLGNVFANAAAGVDKNSSFLTSISDAINLWEEETLTPMINRVKETITSIMTTDTGAGWLETAMAGNTAKYFMNNDMTTGGVSTDQAWTLDEIVEGEGTQGAKGLALLNYAKLANSLSDTQLADLGLDRDYVDLVYSKFGTSKRMKEASDDDYTLGDILLKTFADRRTDDTSDRKPSGSTTSSLPILDESDFISEDEEIAVNNWEQLNQEAKQLKRDGQSYFSSAEEVVFAIANKYWKQAPYGTYGNYWALYKDKLAPDLIEDVIGALSPTNGWNQWSFERQREAADSAIKLLKLMRSHQATASTFFVGDNAITGALPILNFDTGGYTGSWGPEGRFAMLHQKEIVLNASDTSNMLAAVDILRDVVQQIDLQAAANRINSILSPSYTIGTGGDTLQQEVVIHAEFPNATNHSEIEEAFDSLINRASQFANRNR